MDEDVCREILQKLMNLTDMDINIYRELQKVGKSRAIDLSEVFKRDRTTIQRSLNRLVNAGLCYKEKRRMDGGGYFYVYSSKDPNQVRIYMEKCLDRWYVRMKRRIRSSKILI